jgi:hypothetical protein
MARVKIMDIDMERELTDEELEDVFGGQGNQPTQILGWYMPWIQESFTRSKVQSLATRQNMVRGRIYRGGSIL